MPSFALSIQALDFIDEHNVENILLKPVFMHASIYKFFSGYSTETFARFLNNKTFKGAFIFAHGKRRCRGQNARIDIRKVFAHFSFLIGCLDAPMMEGAGGSGNRLSRSAYAVGASA